MGKCREFVRHPHRLAPGILLTLAGWAAAGLVRPPPASAQLPRTPETGGRTVSLGQPPLWRAHYGLSAGAAFEGPTNDLLMRAEAGVYHAPLNPVVGLAELGGEVYGGVRGKQLDGGLRALARVPYLGMGIGADYNLLEGRTDMVVTVRSPIRRGGLFRRGTMLRLTWYPMRSGTFTLGVTAPLGDPLAGRTRPIRDHVVVSGPVYVPAPRAETEPALEAILDTLGQSAEWIRRTVVPFLDQDGRNAQIGQQRTRQSLAELAARLATRSAEQEVRFFHAQLEQAFALAAGSDSAGVLLAASCRRVLLRDVLIPYDALLGRPRSADHLTGMAAVARGRFSREIAAGQMVEADRLDRVLYVFERLTGILERVRHRAGHEWDDPRLTWLPLQYALLPEDHDEQRELDALVAQATGETFTEDNRLSYVANLGFHWALLQMIQDTRSYHVLWIHDFPASGADGLDPVALEQVLGYLAALTARVQEYDSTLTLPSFFIFLDEHYYEVRKSRVLMTLLEDPLGASGRLSLGQQQDWDTLASALDGLRRAVDSSRVLRAERREYGEAWLHNRIKVHVNITNRPDASFWGGGIISSVFGYPDDVMRDHRKITFRDADELDPFHGEAILTGMGVGQQYLGAGWDDRSLVLRGPVLLQLRDGLRAMLLSQGMSAEDMPAALRVRTGLAAPPRDAPHRDARAMALVNGTGYLPKPLNVAKAVLYSLMPAGSVFKIPDSLWNSTFYASLLTGASLRGAQVLIIAPAQDNAPSAGFPQMARAHELFQRLLLVRRELGAALVASGGDLRTGLYALPADSNGFASRADRWVQQVDTSGFLQALLPFARDIRPVVLEASRTVQLGAGACDTDHRAPRLHQKVQFLATRDFREAIGRSAEWPAFMAVYLRYRAATYARACDRRVGALALADSLEQIADRLIATVHALPGAASYAIVGSQNQDYRGMFMDGEVGVLFTGAESLLPLVDLVFMAGTVTWIDTPEQLDALLPPVGELKRRVARIAKDGV